MVGGHVQIAMPDGAVIGGKALAVEPEALRMQIEKPPIRPCTVRGNTACRARGAESVRNADENQAVEGNCDHGGLGGRPTLGAGAGLAVYGGVFGNGSEAAAAATTFGIWGGGTVAGYLLGNAADRKTVTVVVRD